MLSYIAARFFLVLTLAISLVAAFPTPVGNVLSPRFADKSPHVDFVDGKDFLSSGAGDWYADWTKTIDKDSAAWKSRVSEPAYFARKVLGWTDLDCGVTYRGCRNMPMRREILERVDGNEDLALKVWFVLQSMHNMNLVAGVTSEQSSLAQSNCLAMAANIAHTFYWQAGAKDQKKCELQSIFVKETISVMMTILTTSSSGWVGPLGKVAKLLKTNTPESLAYAEFLKFTTPWTWKSALAGPMRAWNKYEKDATTRSAVNYAIGFQAQFTPSAVSLGICSLYPNANAPDMERDHMREMAMHIQQIGRAHRAAIERNMAELNGGVGFGDSGEFLPGDETVMANQVRSGEYAVLNQIRRERFVQRPSLIEEDMTVKFKNALISTALRNSMCHLHCTPKSSFASEPDWCTKNPAHFCPEAETACQTQCWRNSRHAKNIELFGIDKLTAPDNEWETDIASFVQSSFTTWKSSRFDHPGWLPGVDDLLHGSVTSTSGAFLPVCYDQNIKPADFHVKDSHYNRQLPCTCGDAYGNETSLFFNAAGFDSWVDKSTHLADRCQRTMKHAQTPPVAAFLTLCNLGSHWPLKSDRHHAMTNGPDPRCGEVRELVDRLKREQLGDEDINCEICFRQPVGFRIQEDQKDQISTVKGIGRVRASMKASCREFSGRKRCERRVHSVLKHLLEYAPSRAG